MNWARKLEAYSASLCSSKVSVASLLAAEDLDQRVPGEHLLDVSVEPAGGRPLLRRTAAGTACRSAAIARHRYGDQRDQRQQRRDPEHHPEDADDGQHRGDQLAERLLQGHGDVVGVVGGPAQHLTALLVEVATAAAGTASPRPAAAAGTRALHDERGEPALQRAENPREHVDDEHPGQQVRQPRRSRCPGPGEVDRGEQSASGRRPGRGASITCSLVAGRSCLPITPAKMMSVPRPSRYGRAPPGRRWRRRSSTYDASTRWA